MLHKSSPTWLIILCSALISIECGTTSRLTPNKHAHNIIHKEDEITNSTITEFSIDDHSKIVAITPLENERNNSSSEDDLVESTNRRRTSLKVTIPLYHHHEKKLSTIKHPLPKGMHDIMPHEPLRHSAMDQNKVHHDFLHLEGPKLQRRLHHHFTVEEIRQRRKELREKLLARHKKLAHVTPRWPMEKKEDTLMMPLQTTEKMIQDEDGDQNIEKKLETIPLERQKEYVLQKQKDFLEEGNQMENNDSILSNEVSDTKEEEVVRPVTDFLLLDQLKYPEKYKYTITNAITTSKYSEEATTTVKTTTEENKAIPSVSSDETKEQCAPIEDDITRREFVNTEAQRSRLLDYLKRKHRFSAKFNQQTTTMPSLETSTWLEKSENVSHERFISRLKYMLGERNDTSISPDSNVVSNKDDLSGQTVPTAEQNNVQMKSTQYVTSPAVYISKMKQLHPTSTSKPEENSSKINGEPEMNQDWRAHLRKAIRRRLQRLNENSGTK